METESNGKTRKRVCKLLVEERKGRRVWVVKKREVEERRKGEGRVGKK